MTAIIVAGRSGAAFAAEIGTMQVAEELDALTTMGFNPMRFLVMPRVVAVVCVMPLLVLFSDIAGMFGGLLIGIGALKLSVSGYLNETKVALTVAHLASGLLKSVVLGAVIALVGCMRGFQVRGGAESVGHFTTSAVVSGIFLIILLDAIFTVIFQAIGL
jgi:phospholipid/cholesterol/gamma-HCH transport system permease protein